MKSDSRILIRVDNRVRISSLTGISEELAVRLKTAFVHKNPDIGMAIAMGKSTNGIPSTISTWTMSMSGGVTEYSFPRGGMGRIRAILRDAEIDYAVEDKRAVGQRQGMPAPKRTLFNHQLEIVDVVSKRQNIIIKCGTGSGKTTAVLGCFNMVGAPCLVVVNSVALADQWIERCKIDLGLDRNKVGTIGGGKVNLQPVTIAINKTLHKALQSDTYGPTIKSYFGGVFADEIQGAPAKTTYECIDAMPAKYRVGVSADHHRKDKKEFYTTDIFGEVAYEFNHNELADAGRVMDVEVRIINTGYSNDWYGYDPRKTFVHLVQEMAQDQAREGEWLVKLKDEARDGHTILVFAHERAHCEEIVKKIQGMGFSCGLLLGGPESRPEFERTLSGLKTGKVQIGVGTIQAVGTGIDVPNVSVGFAVTPIASNKQNFGQIRGRICRVHPGKTVARLYMVMDPGVYGKKHETNIRMWNPITNIV